MILTNLTYIEYAQKPREWALHDLRLNEINLLVGKNASGKTRTLNVINSLATLVSGRRKNMFQEGEWTADFIHNNQKYKYIIGISDFLVKEEIFRQGRRTLLRRGPDGVGRIRLEKKGELVDFQTPTDQVASVSRRDSLQHSFFSLLNDWGNNVLFFQFGTPMGRNEISVIAKDGPVEFDPLNTDRVLVVFREGMKKYDIQFKQSIIFDMERLGYFIKDIGARTPIDIKVQGPVQGELLGLYIVEQGLGEPVDQNQISQGMFRALSVVIQLNFAILSRDTACILIDDIGEGLDFQRCKAIVEFLMEKSKESNLQLIMSTNDKLVMNMVPLNYWTVLSREEREMNIHNFKNSREKFENFSYTGLNNFEFFSSGYIEN
ncbi:MAG: ATP-binding protein [Rhodospirillaceae bacterium]|jgi:energy-coupling factor transporter ATP-binding protein EcfA2|nr:ATP-binding protein [Rhodospirillaceae bacterium]